MHSPRWSACFKECGQTVENLTELGVGEGGATEPTLHWTGEETHQIQQLVDTLAASYEQNQFLEITELLEE